MGIEKWLEKGINVRDNRGVTSAYFFANMKERTTRPKDLEMEILNMIARIQQMYPELIQPGLKMHKDNRISRSSRRGLKLEA